MLWDCCQRSSANGLVVSFHPTGWQLGHKRLNVGNRETRIKIGAEQTHAEVGVGVGKVADHAVDAAAISAQRQQEQHFAALAADHDAR